ncbi:fibrous sheath CABYR-binding protein-like [Lytechinus variegatus]|uniref:fibrous sheath CABYR-binding protein-like n=1 Tax=Lytechinus variegatus TaxID=7654 RepID=UPI001BB0E47E|nr:fibrous sheath CABYR-binding protein-like [Lytechinus variegatus]
MAVPFSNTKLRVPRGFQNLLEGLAREVLRNQPDNIYAFAAIYFDNLLKMREQQGIDPADIGARHEDRYYNNKAFQNGNVGDVSDPQQQEAAVKIQSAVRGHQSRESSRPEPEAKPSQEDAAVTIQAAYRGYEARKRVHALKEGEAAATTEGDTQEPAAAAPEQPQEEEVDIDLNDPEVEKAAIKIQSSFKGFKTRRDMSAKKSETSVAGETTEQAEPSQQEAGTPAEETSQAEQAPAEASTTEAPSGDAPAAPAQEEEEVDIDLEDPEVEKAAIKIQAGFKGMMVRKGKKEGAKEGEETPASETPAAAAEGEAQAEEPAAETTQEEAPATEESKKEEEEEVDIDLNDPQVQDAAVKIQAGFKGMKVRKQMKEGKSEAGDEEPPTEGDAPQEGAAEPAPTEDAPQEGEQAPAADGEAPAEAEAGQAEEATTAEGDAPEAEATQQEEAATQGEAAPAEETPPAEQEAPKEEEAAPAEGEAAPAEGEAAPAEQAEAPAEDTA